MSSKLQGFSGSPTKYGWWIVVLIVALFGGFAGNRWGIEQERRKARAKVK